MEPPTYSTRSKRKSDELEAISPPPPKKSRISVSPPLSSPSSADAAQVPPSPLESEPPHDFEPPASRGGFRGRGRGRGRTRGRVGRMGRVPVSKHETTTSTTSTTLPAVPGKTSTRGRGGHRVKKSSNARIQSLYHRKQLLRTQYKQVALLQRAALESLAEKSLLAVQEDPKFHEGLPEFGIVVEALAKRFKERKGLLERQYEVQKRYLERQRVLNEEYTRGVYETRVKAIQEKYDLRLKQRAIDEHTQMEMRTGADSPSLHDNDKSHVRRIQDEPFIHPADAWLQGGREAHIAAALEKEQSKKRGGRGKRAAAKPVSPSKPQNSDEAEVAPKKTSLYQPATSLSVATTVDGDSAAPTPAELSEQDDADDFVTDKFGVHIPNKARPRNGDPPNNRIVVEPPFKFDEDEIGIRHHHYKKYNKNDIPTYIGMDPSPNPTNFHYDPWVRNHHSTNNRAEDLDESIVETYKLHPTLGLPVKGSINPTVKERTDWSKPMAETKPIVFVVETNDPEEFKPRFDTSRSAWMEHTERAFEDLGDQLKMAESLEAIGARDPILRPVEENVIPEFEGKISDALLQAVFGPPIPAPQPTVPTSTPILPLPRPTATPAPRTQGYDPVRDTGYSPHIRRSPIKPPRDLGNLGVLADTAETFFGSRPPRGPPPPIHQPPAIPPPRPIQMQFSPFPQPDFYRQPPPPPSPFAAPLPPPQQQHMTLPPFPMVSHPPLLQQQQQQTQFLPYMGPPQMHAGGQQHNQQRYKEILPAPLPPSRRTPQLQLSGWSGFLGGPGGGAGAGVNGVGGANGNGSVNGGGGGGTAGMGTGFGGKGGQSGQGGQGRSG
ncbi:hypothetical protein ACMFMG_011381 [Clarireedia jacksonii]